jgi:integral membrane protein (TIGR01906 family)
MKKAYYLFPILVILLSVFLVTFNTHFYENHVPVYETYSDSVSNLLSFFKGGNLDMNGYSGREIMHLYDVRNLFFTALIVKSFLLIFVFFALRKEKRKVVKQNFFRGGVLSLVITILLSLLLFSFSKNFVLFHKIFFRNDLWILDPSSKLIQMFPEQFFVSAFIEIVIYSLVLSFLLISLGVFIPEEKKNGRKKSNNI